jgi:uncharacterized protein (DUF58 family)
VKRLANIFFTNRFYYTLVFIATAMIIGHFFDWLFILSKVFLLLTCGLLLTDILLLISGTLDGKREVAKRLSNGDLNEVKYTVKNSYNFPIYMNLIDELPNQFQLRNFCISRTITNRSQTFTHHLRPVTRGVYSFGNLQLFAKSRIGFLSIRYTSKEKNNVAVYPSFMALKKTELMAFSPNRFQHTTQKRQRPGNSKEFGQIKEYVTGDDYRKLNWKATARLNKLMVNEYQEEHSRHIYQLIDMGRTMKMPFNGMTLLDYSINASLAVTNIVLKKRDKTGLITYSSQVHTHVKSDNRNLQLHKMLETLYAQETLFEASNLEQVFSTLEKNTQGRSLLLFYTNFESLPGLERQLVLLKKLAKRHLVLMITFINTEMEKIMDTSAYNLEDVYKKAIANNYLINKNTLFEKLSRYGIMHMKVRPDELTMAVINKYLEIKEVGLI